MTRVHIDPCQYGRPKGTNAPGVFVLLLLAIAGWVTLACLAAAALCGYGMHETHNGNRTESQPGGFWALLAAASLLVGLAGGFAWMFFYECARLPPRDQASSP